MNREIMEKLEENYRLQRERNAREEEGRLREVCEKDARVGELISTRRRMILDFCKNAIRNPGAGQPVEQMRAYNRELRERPALPQKIQYDERAARDVGDQRRDQQSLDGV